MERIEGELHVKYIPKRTGSLLGDLIVGNIENPDRNTRVRKLYYADASAYLTTEVEDEVIVLRGKVLREVSYQDNGRKVGVTGALRRNPRIPRIGVMTRVKLEWLSDKS